MPRMIDADALIEELLRLPVVSDDLFGLGFKTAMDCAITKAANAPTIEAKPVRHGTWETSFSYDWDGNKLYIHFHRECGFEYRNYLEDEQPYCPHCGVKMDGNT